MSVLTFAVAASSASADNPKTVLSCARVTSEGTSFLVVYEDAQGAFRYDVSVCQPDPQGNAYDTGPCVDKRGDLQSSEGRFSNTGLDSDVTVNHICAGITVFYDRTTDTQIDFARSQCQSFN